MPGPQIPWGQLERAPEIPVRTVRVAVGDEAEPGARHVCLAHRGIELQGPCVRRLHEWGGFAVGHEPEERHITVAASELGVRERVGRIAVHGFPQESNAAPQGSLGPQQALVSAFERQRIDVRVQLAVAHETTPLGRRDRAAHLPHDIARQLSGEAHGVAPLPEVSLRPEGAIAPAVKQLHGDLHAVTRPRDGCAHDRIHAQLPRDLAEPQSRRVPVPQRRRPGDDAHRFNFRELVDHPLVHSVDEGILRRITREVLKRQHGEAPRGRGSRAAMLHHDPEA